MNLGMSCCGGKRGEARTSGMSSTRERRDV